MKPPRLPVPSLFQTLSSYLRALEPIVQPDQLKRTKRVVNEFFDPNGVGFQLQNFLLKRYQETGNWVQDYFQNSVYLENRSSIPFLQNSVGVKAQSRFTNLRHMAQLTASAICATYHHKNLVQRKMWPPDMWRGAPLCMDQHEKMLRCYRVPQVYRDRQFINENSSEHVIIIHKNQFYCLTLDESCCTETKSQEKVVTSILSVLANPPDVITPAVGLLTALERDVWATTREILLTDVTNAKNLRLIETCMMIVCLDDPITDEILDNGDMGYRPKDPQSQINQMFHGGGSQFNGGNRWFDKDVQMVVSKDGVVGVIMEHSFMDGMVMTLMPKTWPVIQYRKVREDEEEDFKKGLVGVTKMEWNLCSTVLQRIVASGDFVDWTVKNLDYDIYKFNGFGTNFLKTIRCSPNAFIQLAIQLASYKIYGRFVNNYTIAHLRLFQFGRTENIRPLTSELVRWVKYFVNAKDSGRLKNNHQLLSLFGEAIARQVEMTIDASAGRGFDLHLMCLCQAAKELNGSVPELFRDESYKIANHFEIISSQVSSDVEDWTCAFGPDVEDGRGVLYFLNPDSIEFSSMSYRGQVRSASSLEFLTVLAETLDEMRIMVRSTR